MTTQFEKIQSFFPKSSCESFFTHPNYSFFITYARKDLRELWLSLSSTDTRADSCDWMAAAAHVFTHNMSL